MNQKLIYMKQGFHPYKIPIFEELNSRAGKGGFQVIALKHPEEPNERLALSMGSFRRQLVYGKHLSLTRHHDEGRETALRFTIAPTLPLAIKRSHASVIISDTFTTWTLTAILMRYRVVIFWEGTFHTERTIGGLRRGLRRWMARRARAFVVNGTLSKKYLMDELNVSPDRIYVGGLCTSIPPTDAVREPRIVPNEEPVKFLFAARLIEGKGARHLIEAASLLERNVATKSRFQITIVGDGPDRAWLEALCASSDTSRCITFTGYVNPADIWGHYGDSHVFVLPTLHDNWPLVVPEAMTTGLPVLLSNLAGSAPDLIEEDQNGYTFTPSDHEQLAQLMSRYIENHALIRQHGERSTQIVAPYTPSRIADVYWAAVQAAIGNGER